MERDIYLTTTGQKEERDRHTLRTTMLSILVLTLSKGLDRECSGITEKQPHCSALRLCQSSGPHSSW